MLTNYLKIAFRTLRKHPAYAVINVAGLAVGMACFMLIMLYVQDERRYDHFHEKADRIVRITSEYTDETGRRSFARSYPAIGPTLVRDVAEVERTVRFQRFQGALRYEDRLFNEDYMFFAEASVFDVFTFPLLQGDPATALTEPNTAVLTESAARRYFGQDDPLGKTIVLSDTLAFTVTGMAQDVPLASHLRFEILLSFETLRNIAAARGRHLDEIWTSGTFYTYALLATPGAVAAVEAQLPAYVERYIGDQAGTGAVFSLALQPITDIHLRSDLRQELGPNGNLTYVYVFSAIAVFILLISCINFMNLSTARSVQRAREVGVRKALGAQRGQLVRQFLSEAMLLGFVALVLAGVLAALVLPWFNDFTGKALSFDPARHWAYVPAALGLAALVGMLAGSYPAFLLSAFRPVHVLKGTMRVGRQRLATVLRRSLVVFQFALSIGIIAGTVVAWQQLDYMRSRHLGFDQEQILVLPFNWEQVVVERFETLKAALLQDASVRQVTASGDVPGRMFTSMSYWIEGMPEGERGGINALIVDPDFAETYGLEMVAGRDFSPDLAANLGETFILNEAAVREMGLTPEEAVGKPFRMNTTGPVIGVVKDFHFEGLQKSLEPLVMTVWPSWFGYVSLRLDTGTLPQTLAHVERVWQSVVPTLPFEYLFLDDDFARQYRAEAQFGQVFMVFGVLAIFISCLGLFGLAAFTAERRTKEIGVRKVLGASASNIVLLLNRDVTVLVVLAAVLAAPIAYFAMHRWLDAFAYRIDISWGIFLLAGLVALAVTWLTVAYQSIRAALADPVEALRYE